jgi:hypothetical protein
MNGVTIVEIINSQINSIKKINQTPEDTLVELAILRSFILHQELLPEMEEFRNLIYMELEEEK